MYAGRLHRSAIQQPARAVGQQRHRGDSQRRPHGQEHRNSCSRLVATPVHSALNCSACCWYAGGEVSAPEAASPEFTESGLMSTRTADSDAAPGPHHAVPKPTCCVGSGMNANRNAAMTRAAPATVPAVRITRQ